MALDLSQALEGGFVEIRAGKAGVKIDLLPK
jgi:hypothetical protein